MTTPDSRPKSVSFEQQIHRIHELLSTTEAQVTWNDRVLDPDCDRARQIDVTVKRGDHLTLIECRAHSARQDVTWIEELIGRRQSLRANAIIAVSASGFTRGAIAKATAHNVVLRDLRELSEQEIAGWGRSIGLKLYFFQYQNIHLSLVLMLSDVRSVDRRELERSLRDHPLLVTVFNAAARLVGERLIPATEADNLTADFGVSGTFQDVSICGHRVLEARLEGQARLLSQSVQCPVVSGYGSPAAGVLGREATVQQFDLGATSIVHEGRKIALHLDLALVETPPLCQFRYAATDGDHEVDVESFSLVGLENLNVRKGKIALAVLGLPESSVGSGSHDAMDT